MIGTKFIGMNSIGEDAYFVKLRNKDNYFVHFEGSNDDNVVYLIKEGAVGAAIFRKAQANNFINSSGANNLITVRVKDVLGEDYSKN